MIKMKVIICLSVACMIVTIIFCVGFANSTDMVAHQSPMIQNIPQVEKSIIDVAIKEQEWKIATTTFVKDDIVDGTLEINDFLVNNENGSLSSNPEQDKSGSAIPLSSLKSDYLGNVPNGGYVRHGSDGKTRVFSPDGKQLYFIDDSNTKKILNPSGYEKAASYSFAVPSGSIIERKNDKTFVVFNGTIIFTVINDNWTSQSNQNSGNPEQKGSSWIEYAESSTSSTFGKFSSLWYIPHSPDLQLGFTNILFNGIESSDPALTYILQPVTAYNFSSNCKNGWNPPPRPIEPGCIYQFVWTGSAWIVFGPEADDWHTYPPVSFSENDPAWGYVWWSGDRYWVQIKNERTDGAANIGLSGFSLNPSYQQTVVAYEAHPIYPISFPDNQKIHSTTFTQMWAEDMGNNPITLNWINTINFAGHPLITGLHVNLSQAPSTVILETDSKGSKIGVFRSGQWILDYGRDGIVDRRFNYGLPTDVPVVGDFNNNGQTDIGVFRSGQWILDYGMDGTVDRRLNFGQTGDKPVVGDFNNDGITDIGAFRSGQWILDYGMDGVIDRYLNYGLATDIPVVGDFNNNGQTDIGVFRSGQWILDYGIDGTVDRRLNYGRATDIPVVGNFNNDGQTDIGVFRSGQWILDYGMDGIIDRYLNYGLATDIPLAGKWI